MAEAPVSPPHEALHRLFRHDRGLFARTVRNVFQVDVPVPDSVSLMDTDFTEVRPHVRRGDSVLLAELHVEDSTQRYIVLIEAQLSENKDKKRSWPYYVA